MGIFGLGDGLDGGGEGVMGGDEEKSAKEEPRISTQTPIHECIIRITPGREGNGCIKEKEMV